MKIIISHKIFPKTISLLFSFIILFLLNTACDSNNVTNISPANGFDRMLDSQRTFITNSILKTENDEKLIKVPTAALYLKQNKEPQVVLRKTTIKNKAYFQVVEVKVVNSIDDFSFIKGINVGDELVLNPRRELKKMAKIDRLKTKERILKKQKLHPTT